MVLRCQVPDLAGCNRHRTEGTTMYPAPTWDISNEPRWIPQGELRLLRRLAFGQ